jgi:hypothetical protein
VRYVGVLYGRHRALHFHHFKDRLCMISSKSHINEYKVFQYKARHKLLGYSEENKRNH